ncbi:MAG: hypothetical protein QOJ97_2270 [Solirubrobacteraceae bacterium]|jgi:hypothetical protein|nr:hypothetical protein [Solirubrobacteraceae bacterium]
MRRRALLVAVTLAALTAPATASAETLLDTTVAADRAVARDCVASPISAGDGLAVSGVTVPATGWVTARLSGSAPGDWDLALFDADTGRRVAASAGFGSNEVAGGLAQAGQRLSVQACRRDAGGRTAQLSVDSVRIDGGPSERISMARVITPDRAAKQRLSALNLDVTEHGGRGFVGVLLHGAADATKLRRAGFSYIVDVPDLQAQAAADRQADAIFARSVHASALPSGRTSYRTLADYERDLKALAEANPDIVKPLVLPHQTGEGRSVNGIEITTDPAKADGKPVFALMGLHHSREWPSGENTIEFAIDLVNGYRSGDARSRRLVAEARTVVIPVVNPDGFNASRTFGATADPRTGRGAPNEAEDDETVNILTHPNEYRRKNCRVPNSDRYTCAGPALGLASTGVDPNRNYGALWGGEGASADPLGETYRGPGPFSEPETKNIRDLVSTRQVVTLITNHTFSNLVLRPPGVAAQGAPVDESLLKRLGDAMAAENGYTSQRGYELYDTTGTTEDWSYGVTGGLGYTFEIGCVDKDTATGECKTGHFHPPFAEAVKEYEGTTPYADANGHDGKGNREAYFLALESTVDSARHAVLQGRAPAGAVLKLHKEFTTETSPVLDDRGRDGAVQTFQDKLDTTMTVPASGSFEWHVNPSTRPLVALERGSHQSGTPSPPQSFSGDPSTAAPCGDPSTGDDTCVNDHVFEIPNDPTKDNAVAVVRIDWTTPASDWDMRVYRADASGQPVGTPVGASQQGTTVYEQTKIAGQPGRYVVRVNNYAAAEPYTGSVSFRATEPFRGAKVESWTLTCKSPSGTATQAVTIGRGERRTLDLSACGPISGGMTGAGPGTGAIAPRSAAGAAGAGAARCADRSAPVTSFARGGLRASRSALTLAGASRDRGCGARGAGAVSRVYVAVYRPGAGGCRHLQAGGRLSARRSCARPTFLRAAGASRWRFSRRVSLPAGRYVALASARDAAGNAERARRIGFRVR